MFHEFGSAAQAIKVEIKAILQMKLQSLYQTVALDTEIIFYFFSLCART